MSQVFVLLSKAASQLLFYVLAKLSTQVKVYGSTKSRSTGVSKLRFKIQISKQKLLELKNSPRWMDGWMDGYKSCFKDCLLQSKIAHFGSGLSMAHDILG